MQGSHSSWLVAIAVMAVGFLVAIPFHQEAPPPSGDSLDFNHFSEGLIWQEDTYSPKSSTSDSRDHRLGPLHQDREVTAVAANEAEEINVPPPPRMEGQYGGLAEKFGAPLASRGRSERGRGNPDSDYALRKDSSPFAPRAHSSRTQRDLALDRLVPNSDSVPGDTQTVPLPQVAARFPLRTRADRPVTPPRLHWIVDGDTLTSIAARYLGDSGRAEDIFRANRDVLPNPELLPVGRQLRIPSSTAFETPIRDSTQPPPVAADGRADSDVPQRPERTESLIHTRLNSPASAPRTNLQPLR